MTAMQAQSIMTSVENGWCGFGSAFGSVIILSLFRRCFTYKGALVGIIADALTDVLWLIFLSVPIGIYDKATAPHKILGAY